MNTLVTKKLQANLKNCIGRKTVNFENETVYHYGSPIVTVDGKKLILNSHYWAYSASTSRVRNAALKYFSGYTVVPSTTQLKRARKNGEILTLGLMEIWFSDWLD